MKDTELDRIAASRILAGREGESLFSKTGDLRELRRDLEGILYDARRIFEAEAR